MKSGQIHYLNGWPEDPLCEALVAELTDDAGLKTLKLPKNILKREITAGVFVWNYGTDCVELSEIGFAGQTKLGSAKLKLADVVLIRLSRTGLGLYVVRWLPYLSLVMCQDRCKL